LPDALPPAGQAAWQAGSLWLRARPIFQVKGVGIDLFGRRVRLTPVEEARRVRARCHAVTAAETPVIIHHHDAIRLHPGGLDGACLYTRGIVAVHALHGQVVLAFFGHLAFPEAPVPRLPGVALTAHDVGLVEGGP